MADVRRRVHAAATRPRVESGALWAAWAIAFWYAFNRVFHRAMVTDWSLYGTHDWDSHIAYRYISTLSLLKYGEMPWFSPWFCHGFPAWAYVEGASNILSPYLPIYLLTPINVASRFEAIASSAVGLIGAFFLARRFTRSFALASFAAFIYVLNSRWALQFQAGHTWHLQYAWVPWVFYLFDKSCREGTAWHAVGAGIVSGLIVTMGGIYPAPHVALAFPVYCIALMITERTWLPLGRAVVMGASALGFSAPKLIPLVLLMERFPRLVTSDEKYNLDQFFLLLTKSEKFRVPPWDWHENGSFIGAVPLVIILVALVLPSPRKTRVFRVLGVLFAVLGMGAFNNYAPWTLLHDYPPFASQHVPTRFMLMSLLFLGIDAAATFSALLDAFFRRFRSLKPYYPWLDAALLLGVVLICKPMFNVSRDPVSHTFERRMLPITPAAHFQHAYPTAEIDYNERHGFGAILPAMFANIGADTECHTVPQPPMGAIIKEDKSYRGEAYFDAGPGQAEVVHFTPSTAEVKYHDALPNSVLIYNMNYHPGWSANGEPAIEVNNAVAFRVSGSSGTVRFAYRPPGLIAGVAIGLVFVFALAYARFGATLRHRWRQRVRERREHEPRAQHE
ncbi:MAG TPA: hypothetical protein VFN67_13255, partial [Polyangiales bacterium]|nr:hypothetical protein [Polyangiales bacterium]